MPRIEILPSAARALAKLQVPIRSRIATRIDALGMDPRPSGAQKLRGSDDVWRLRIGDYRVLYQIGDDRLTIVVVKIAHRREAYRRG